MFSCVCFSDPVAHLAYNCLIFHPKLAGCFLRHFIDCDIYEQFFFYRRAGSFTTPLSIKINRNNYSTISIRIWLTVIRLLPIILYLQLM